jgi:hypothetical protein
VRFQGLTEHTMMPSCDMYGVDAHCHKLGEWQCQHGHTGTQAIHTFSDCTPRVNTHM